MEKNDCMIIRGATVSADGTEQKFRPATTSPDKHWSYLLMDNYRHRLDFSIKWIDNEPMITITKGSHKEDEIAFKHIMEFAKLHNLDVTWCVRECDNCEGHESCLSKDSKK